MHGIEKLTGECLPMQARRATFTEQLRAKVESLTGQLAEATAALAALEQNPEVARTLDAIARAV